VNARPAQAEGPLPGAAALAHDFSAATPGTVADRAGLGTGFAGTLANTAGNQAVPAKLERDTAGGVLRVTSDPGTYSGATNTQRNALFDTFSAARGDVRVQARVRGPLDVLTAARQHQGVWFGPGQDDYVKWEVEFRSGVPTLILFVEQGGTGRTIGTVALPNPGSVTTLDLFLTLDLGAGTVQAGYRVNSDTGAITSYGAAQAPGAVLAWFSRQAKAGVVVSNEGTTTTFVATYDSFQVGAL
jgi:hypothetical protein